MLPQYKSNTNLFIGIGLALTLLNPVFGYLAPLAALVGWIFIIIGCSYYAKAKGYHGALGLFGLLNIIGLIVLVCLKDKHKESEKK